MASPIFQGILMGLAEAHQAHRTKLFEDEKSRRSAMADFLKREAANPNRLPESQQELQQQYLELASTPFEKKLKPDFEPRVLQSIMRVQARPRPTGKIETLAPPFPNAPAIPTNIRAEIGEATPPPGYMEQRSAFYSPEEQMRMGVTAKEMEAEAEARGKARGTPPESEEYFPFGERQTGIMGRRTARVVREPEAPKPPAATNLQRDTQLYKGKPTDVMVGVDPDSKDSYGRVFLPTPTGLQDITGQTSHYEKPPTERFVGGLSTQANTAAQRLASQFDSNPVVRQYNEAILRASNVQQILNSKWSGPGDMAVVFEFMRALDPTSVVRESEYATAAKTGNWFKGIFARFNGLFNPEGGFLSDQVKADFNKVLQGKVQQAGKQVKGIYNDFGRRIDKITGVPGTGLDYLTDYTQMLPTAPDVPSEDLKSLSDDELFRRLAR